METPRKYALHSLLVIVFFLVVVAAGNISRHATAEKARVCRALRTELSENAFGALGDRIVAKAAYVYDFKHKVALFSKNEREPLPLASLAKIMTIRVALEHTSVRDSYRATEADLETFGWSSFEAGDSYVVRDLVAAALIPSSNDAATMLAQASGMSLAQFITTMNTEASVLRLPTLAYQSVTGLDAEGGQASAFGSARDTVELLYRSAEDFPELFALSTKPAITIRSVSGARAELKNTNLASDKLPLLMASKTGYTIAAGGNLAILWQEPGGAVLGASVLGSTENGRFSDMIVLHDAADRYISSLRAVPAYCI
jgi:D-alanyl-D-alanine carboxypeptidase (penicillin-binding protein 5/6)